MRRTVEAYLRVPEFHQTVSLKKNEFDKLKIGYFGQLDRLLSNERKNNKVWQDAVNGVNSAEVRKSRDAVRQATPEDIRTYAALFEEAVNNSCIAVTGGAIEKYNAAECAFHWSRPDGKSSYIFLSETPGTFIDSDTIVYRAQQLRGTKDFLV